MEAQSINIGYGNFKAAGAAYNLVPDSAMLMSRTGSLDLKAVGELNVPWVFEHGLSRGFGEQWTRILLGQLAEYMYDLRVKPPDKSCQSVELKRGHRQCVLGVSILRKHLTHLSLLTQPSVLTKQPGSSNSSIIQSFLHSRQRIISAQVQTPCNNLSLRHLPSCGSPTKIVYFRIRHRLSRFLSFSPFPLFPNQSKNIISCKKWQKHMINL